MKTRRLLVRPKWTLGTMLLIVGWSAVVVWLNVRPQGVGRQRFLIDEEGIISISVEHGFPKKYAFNPYLPSRFGPAGALLHDGWAWALARNIVWGLCVVGLLTFASKYLVRAIVSGVRRSLSKPPPDKGNGP